MSLKLGELVAILKTDNRPLRDGLAAGRMEVRRGGRDMETEAAATAVAMSTVLGAGGQRAGAEFVRGADGRLRDTRGRFLRAGEEAGEAFSRGADGKLRDSRGRFVATGRSLGDAAGQGARGGIDSLRGGLNNLGTVGTNVTSNLWNLIPILAAIAAAAALATPAVHLLGGALGALPALAGGALSVFGALGLGVMGLGDHFKETSSAGGALADKTWQVHQAQRGLANAQREVVDAQEALTRAREAEVERLSDLNRELREARLSEQEAALDEQEAAKRLADARNAVAIAERKIAMAQQSGDADAIRRARQELLEAQRNAPNEIRRAELAYERAKLAIESTKDRTEDLTLEQQRAARVGVEGSDQVRAALDRQRRAVEALEDAQHALNEARKPAGGGGGAGQELTRLAPAAQRLVAVIKSLKPAWESLRLDVQQRLFEGVGGEVQALADSWLPVLHRRLGGTATTLNGIFKTFSRSVRKPEFIARMEAGLEAVDRLVGRVGRSIAGPFVDAWGRLTEASVPFIDALGEEIAGLIDDFSRWIKSADESGKLESFFEKAGDFLRDTFDIGRDVASIFGSIMEILFGNPDRAKTATEPWENLKNWLDEIAKWFKDPENQEKIAEWVKKFMDLALWIRDEGIPMVADWIEEIDGWVDTIDRWKDKIKALENSVVGTFVRLGAGVGKAVRDMRRSTSGMWDGIRESFRAAVNWVISRWNGLELRLPSVSFLGQTIGGGSIGTPNIPHLAVGGDVLESGLAVIHKGERVVPAAQVDRLPTGGGHAEARLTGEFRIRGRDLVLVLREQVLDLSGGDVQAAIGRKRR